MPIADTLDGAFADVEEFGEGSGGGAEGAEVADFVVAVFVEECGEFSLAHLVLAEREGAFQAFGEEVAAGVLVLTKACL